MISTALLDVVHAPAWAEELAHFAHAFANRAHVAQQTPCGLLKPANEPRARGRVFQAVKPSIELRQRLYRIHEELYSIEYLMAKWAGLTD